MYRRPARCRDIRDTSVKTAIILITDTWTEPLEHDYEATVKAPDLYRDGVTQYYTCKNCGYSYTR